MASTSATQPEVKLTKNVIDEFNKMRSDQRTISQSIIELESDINEHKIVLAALSKAPQDRKCFRMVGGVLMEQKVPEAAEGLVTNLKRMQEYLNKLNDQFKNKGEQLAEFAKVNGLASFIRSNLDQEKSA